MGSFLFENHQREVLKVICQNSCKLVVVSSLLVLCKVCILSHIYPIEFFIPSFKDFSYGLD